jgi:hypothetical protein
MTNSLDSLWKKVEKRGPDECWEWRGYRNFTTYGKGGYGRMDLLGLKGVYVHRIAYLSANPGALTLSRKTDLQVLHKCDNPICCNPAHLMLGTNADNVADMMNKGRQTRYKSTESPRAKFTEEEVFWIRMAKKYGATVKALALLHRVSMSCISHLLYGRSYQDV